MTSPASPTSLSGYAARPDYRVDLLRRPNHVEARIGARRLASSARTIIVDEQDHAIVIYFPREDVDMEALVSCANHSTHCPYKGTAVYWALAQAPADPIAWSYPSLYPQVALITDYIAFQQDKVDVLIGAKNAQAQSA